MSSEVRLLLPGAPHLAWVGSCLITGCMLCVLEPSGPLLCPPDGAIGRRNWWAQGHRLGLGERLTVELLGW